MHGQVTRTAFPHNTPDEVREYLRAGLELVDELGPADDQRVAVFTEAVRLVSGKQIFYEQPQPVALDLRQLRGH
jgi:hypothetical protein